MDNSSDFSSSSPWTNSRSRVVRVMLASHQPVEVIRRKGVVKFNPSFFEMVRRGAVVRARERVQASAATDAVHARRSLWRTRAPDRAY